MANDTMTRDGEAIKFFNLVRERAGMDELDPAQDTLFFSALFKERRIELAAESHFWFDVVRLSYYNFPKAKEFLDNQERIPFDYDGTIATPGNAYTEITPASEGTFRFPLPASEVTANPKLADAPVPYSFKSE